MITLTHVKLRNFCQYDEFESDISTGLTAIVGRNGSGKTTLLRAIAYGLTGLVDGSWGTQSDLQKDNTSVPGFVELTVTDGSEELTIRRFSTPSVKFPDVILNNKLDTLASGRKKVNAFIEERTGLSSQLMFQICWGRQGELAALLRATPGTISSFLSMLFDTRIMDKIREKIKIQLDTIAMLPSDCEQQLQATVKELEALPADESIQQQDESIQAALKTVEDAIGEFDGQQRIPWAQKQALIAQAEARVHDLSQRALEIPAVEGQTRDDMDLSSALAERSRLDASDRELQRLRMHAVTAYNAHENSVRQATLDYAACNERRQRVMDAILSDNCKCPLCGGEIHDKTLYAASAMKYLVPDYVGTAEQYVAEMSKRMEQLQSDISRYTELVREREQYIIDADKRAAEIDAQRNIVQNTINKLHADAIDSDYLAAKEKLNEARNLPAWDDASSASYTKLLSDRDALRQAHEDCIKRLAQNKTSRELLTKYKADYEKAVAQYAVNRDARQVLTDIRDALSQSRAQARYMQTRIEMLNRHLAKYVRQTGMPFNIRLDPDKRMFLYTTPDGAEHPAAHLSGAQQAMASVALQMAIFAVSTPNMNLYLIDEPTEACDDANKEVMAQMFERMNLMLESASGTMLIVARDETTLASCGNTIEVNNDN